MRSVIELNERARLRTSGGPSCSSARSSNAPAATRCVLRRSRLSGDVTPLAMNNAATTAPPKEMTKTITSPRDLRFARSSMTTAG